MAKSGTRNKISLNPILLSVKLAWTSILSGFLESEAIEGYFNKSVSLSRFVLGVTSTKFFKKAFCDAYSNCVLNLVTSKSLLSINERLFIIPFIILVV